MEGGKEDKKGRENERKCFIKASPPVRSGPIKALKMLRRDLPVVLYVLPAR